jgi:hypothetical protein
MAVVLAQCRRTKTPKGWATVSMSGFAGFRGRIAAALCAALAVAAVDVSAAYAQSSCGRLEATLATFDTNRDYANYEMRSDELRSIQRDLQAIESLYIRNGCNDAAKAGQPLNAECRGLARQINDGRAQVDALGRSVETGAAIAQQREAILQEIARFGCNTGSSATFSAEPQQPRNLFEQLFGGGGISSPDAFSTGDPFSQDLREDGFYFDGYAGYSTVRTLCVRMCDGFYWPVSYSTLPDYAINDAGQCQQQCPGAEVELFYHRNPGEEPEQAVSLYGVSYSSLPNALKYRTSYDPGCTCHQKISYGQINIADAGTAQSRPIIDFNGNKFPLPLRDPRRQIAAPTTAEAAVEPTEVADVQYVDIPLPRPRPTAPGEEPKAVPVATPVGPARYAKFGDKTVRIVGPDTPYAPEVEAGG